MAAGDATYTDHLNELGIARSRTAQGIPHRNLFRVMIAFQNLVIVRSAIPKGIIDALI